MKGSSIPLRFPEELKEMMKIPDIKIKEKPFYSKFLNKKRKRMILMKIYLMKK
jgi:hypothetical protein